MKLVERDFFRDRLSEDEIRELLAESPASDLFSWKSPRARALGLSADSPPPHDELVRMMAEDPYLIRRPVIVAEERVIIGFDRKALEALLP